MRLFKKTPERILHARPGLRKEFVGHLSDVFNESNLLDFLASLQEKVKDKDWESWLVFSLEEEEMIKKEALRFFPKGKGNSCPVTFLNNLLGKYKSSKKFTIIMEAKFYRHQYNGVEHAHLAIYLS